MSTITTSVATAALLTAVLNVSFAGAATQPFADSTGGSSQARGELVPTPAGIVPAPRSHGSVRVEAADRVAPGYADSTGGSSMAGAERALDAESRPAVALAATPRM